MAGIGSVTDGYVPGSVPAPLRRWTAQNLPGFMNREPGPDSRTPELRNNDWDPRIMKYVRSGGHLSKRDWTTVLSTFKRMRSEGRFDDAGNYRPREEPAPAATGGLAQYLTSHLSGPQQAIVRPVVTGAARGVSMLWKTADIPFRTLGIEHSWLRSVYDRMDENIDAYAPKPSDTGIGLVDTAVDVANQVAQVIPMAAVAASTGNPAAVFGAGTGTDVLNMETELGVPKPTAAVDAVVRGGLESFIWGARLPVPRTGSAAVNRLVSSSPRLAHGAATAGRSVVSTAVDAAADGDRIMDVLTRNAGVVDPDAVPIGPGDEKFTRYVVDDIRRNREPDDGRVRQAAKAGKELGNFLATDEVPPTLFGVPVVSAEEQYTEKDLAFFKEHPEAGGYYDMGVEDA